MQSDISWEHCFDTFMQTHDEAVLVTAYSELTLIVPLDQISSVLEGCKQTLDMDTLLDVCGVDYLHFGQEQWVSTIATSEGYSRGPDAFDDQVRLPTGMQRFACVYHLLSKKWKLRLRVKTFLDATLRIPSMVRIWPSANWYEREAYDLFGFVFTGHPALARILTDYAFIGHPFRKDYPVSGYNEMRYSAQHERCIYEPTTIEPRTTVPKVIRTYDNRYAKPRGKQERDE